MHREQLVIHEPCHADWDQMSGDERRRFCGSCNQHVHDLNQLTAEEAEALLESSDELCVQYQAGPTGELAFKSKRRGALAALAVVGALVGTPAFASGATNGSNSIVESLQHWWNNSATEVVSQETVSKPVSVIAEVTQPVGTVPVTVTIPETIPEPPKVEERYPKIKGRISSHRWRPATTEPNVDSK